MLIQFIINGLVNGAIFSLIALGFALIYNTTKIFHIAYSILFTVSPYLLYSFSIQLKLPIGIGIVLAILGTIILSLLIEIMVYKPLDNRKSSLNVIMISSIGVMIVIINIIALIYGNETKIIDPNIPKSISISNVIITYPQIIQLFTSISFGIKTRAMRDDIYLCEIFSMNIRNFRLFLFALSALFVAIGGMLIAYDVGVDPYVGLPMLLNAVVALIIGGIGRFYAPIIGGFVIGLLQSIVAWKFSANWQDAVTFSILIIFLLFRPQGLFGEKRRFV